MGNVREIETDVDEILLVSIMIKKFLVDFAKIAL